MNLIIPENYNPVTLCNDKTTNAASNIQKCLMPDHAHLYGAVRILYLTIVKALKELSVNRVAELMLSGLQAFDWYDDTFHFVHASQNRAANIQLIYK